MIYLIPAGLIALLGVLLLVRSAQQGAELLDAAPPKRSAEAAPTPHTASSTDTNPAVPPRDFDRENYMLVSKRIARRGESRAGTLDFFGYLVSTLATLVVVVVAIFAGDSNETLTADERVLVALTTGGAVLGLVAVAAILFGFGALVRNTSRILSISADRALDIPAISQHE